MAVSLAAQARQDVAALTERAERQLDAVFAPLAPRLGDAVRRHAAGGIITQAGRRAILRDLDRLLGAPYGPPTLAGTRQGAVYRIAVEGASAAFTAPLAREVQRASRRLRRDGETALLAAMMRPPEEGRDGTA